MNKRPSNIFERKYHTSDNRHGSQLALFDKSSNTFAIENEKHETFYCRQI